LDLSTWEWDELKSKGGPSARSGHRMLCHHGKLFLFGGFYDSGDLMPKYFKDLWAFDIETLKWESLGNMSAKWPQARSAFQWAAFDGKLVMHGGYARKVDEDDHEMEHGTALNDTWCWHVDSAKVCAPQHA
jgi:N-acetylneuraminic acid mutarotase